MRQPKPIHAMHMQMRVADEQNFLHNHAGKRVNADRTCCTQAIFTAGSPAATTELKALAATRQRFCAYAVYRTAMHRPRLLTTAANMLAFACHGA